MILALKTASAQATLVLLNLDDSQASEDIWEAGRKLSGELLPHIEKLLQTWQLEWASLTGIIIFRGPGSFTGLRIGCSVANAIAYAQDVPIVGSLGDDWIKDGLRRLEKKDNDKQVVPLYGSPPNISKPRGSA